MLCQVVQQLPWNRLIPRSLRQRRAIAAITHQATFVFDLHHDDRVRRVTVPQMSLKCLKRMRIACNRCVPQGVQHIKSQPHKRSSAALCYCHRKTLRIFLHPQRNVTRACIFPGSKPDKHKMLSMLPGGADLLID